MKVEYKYKPGQDVYIPFMDSFPMFKNCDTCNGVGKLFKKSSASELIALGTSEYSEVKCFECKGVKEIESGGSLKYVVKKKTVGVVDITIDGDVEPEAEYSFSDGTTFTEGNLFKTKKEAQEECNRMNKGCYAGYSK